MPLSLFAARSKPHRLARAACSARFGSPSIGQLRASSSQTPREPIPAESQPQSVSARSNESSNEHISSVERRRDEVAKQFSGVKQRKAVWSKTIIPKNIAEFQLPPPASYSIAGDSLTVPQDESPPGSSSDEVLNSLEKIVGRSQDQSSSTKTSGPPNESNKNRSLLAGTSCSRKLHTSVGTVEHRRGFSSSSHRSRSSKLYSHNASTLFSLRNESEDPSREASNSPNVSNSITLSLHRLVSSDSNYFSCSGISPSPPQNSSLQLQNETTLGRNASLQEAANRLVRCLASTWLSPADDSRRRHYTKFTKSVSRESALSEVGKWSGTANPTERHRFLTLVSTTSMKCFSELGDAEITNKLNPQSKKANHIVLTGTEGKTLETRSSSSCKLPKLPSSSASSHGLRTVPLTGESSISTVTIDTSSSVEDAMTSNRSSTSQETPSHTQNIVQILEELIAVSLRRDGYPRFLAPVTSNEFLCLALKSFRAVGDLPEPHSTRVTTSNPFAMLCAFVLAIYTQVGRSERTVTRRIQWTPIVRLIKEVSKLHEKLPSKPATETLGEIKLRARRLLRMSSRPEIIQKPSYTSSNIAPSTAPKRNAPVVSVQEAMDITSGSITNDSVVVHPIPRSSNERPIATLAHGLDRVLFNPAPYTLQDPHTNVFNFDPVLQTVPSLADFDFNRLPEFISSSQHVEFHKLARQHGRRFVGSTSSLTGLLSHVYFLISRDRFVNTQEFSQTFRNASRSFTRAARTAEGVILRYVDGIYSTDADQTQVKSSDTPTILSELGTMLESFLTLPTEEFVKLRKSVPIPPGEDIRKPNAYQYTLTNSYLMRSQLDCHDPRLPGSGFFDIKTRAAIAIRLDLQNYLQTSGYLIRHLTGEFESYEREQYDLLRSGLLKYNFQARIGNMDGIIIAYHNTAQIFGFQYMPLNDMDQALFHDLGVGDTVFRMCIGLFEKVMDEVQKCYPRQDVKLMFETQEFGKSMHVWVEPIEWDSSHGRAPVTELKIYVGTFYDGTFIFTPNFNRTDWTLTYDIIRNKPSVLTRRRLDDARRRRAEVGHHPIDYSRSSKVPAYPDNVSQDPIEEVMHGSPELPVRHSSVARSRGRGLCSKKPGNLIARLRELSRAGRLHTEKSLKEPKDDVKMWNSVP